MSQTTPHASPAGPSASTSYRPSPSSGTPSSSSSSKPRLLYRGPLRLSDGTLLNGVAFVSTVDPFEKGVGERGGGAAAAGADDADICLALEMARGQRCLAIEAMNDVATTSGPLKVSAASNSLATGSGAGWDVHLEASGKVRMYIDPNEPLTAAFFERNFCCGGEGWDEEGRGRERSRTAFLISTGPSIPAATTIAVPQAASSQAQHEDVFTNSYTAASSSAAMAAPLPLVERRSAALQLVLFARMSENSTDGVLEIVVGRRVAQRRRSTGASKAEGAAVAGGSATTVSRRASQGVRPDDPLPRVAGGIVGQKVKQPEIPTQPAPAGPSTWRKTASAPNLARPSPVPPPARGVAKASAEGGADKSLMSVKEEEDDDEQPSAPSFSRATSAGARGASSTAPAITGGNHTPGRRGEKRRSTTTATATAKQQQQRSQEHLLLSPTSSSKRRRTALAPTSATLAKGTAPSSSSSSASGVAAPPRPEPLPLQPLQPPQPRTRRDVASPTPGLDAPPLSATFAPSSTTAKTSSSTTSTGYTAIETKNRAMIKKLVQHQLLGRGLERRPRRDAPEQAGREGSVDPMLAVPEEEDGARNDDEAEATAGDGAEEEEEEDFDRLFLGAYTSTCVALRKDLHKKPVRRDVAARVVRWHLDLYLEDRDCALNGGSGGGAGGGAEA